MEEQIRLSVRALVEFTHHGADILPGGSLRDMQEGMLGHQARQKLLKGDGWVAEMPLQLQIPGEDDCSPILITGRMDAFRDGMIPEIEEIKLWQGEQPPEAPEEAHRLQAVCYGHILCTDRGAERVIVRVVYVTSRGMALAVFEEELTAAECRMQFMELLLAYQRRIRMVNRHRRARNASLQHLAFPFETYRKGQREMAAQVYTAIRLQKRLFASLPTGTGKSAATLFPALKALGNELTEQVYYLTARTTQRQAPLEALTKMRHQHLNLWVLTLDAKDKQCPRRTVCHPDWCERAKGHFLRDSAALEEMLQMEDWSPQTIRAVAERYRLCPFEFSLLLCEMADVVICDYNYALDPAVHIKRIFDHPGSLTLLVDEGHHLWDRTRDMLGGTVSGKDVAALRTVTGKVKGRTHKLYKALSAVLKDLDSMAEAGAPGESVAEKLPSSLENDLLNAAEALAASQREAFPWEEKGELMTETLSQMYAMVRAIRREDTPYAWLRQGRKHPSLTALALDVAPYLTEATKRMSMICFSATMEPLTHMKTLLGGEEDDACFSAPSPFPPEHLLVVRENVDTRYHSREESASAVADLIRDAAARPGRYLVYFPSFAYLNMVREKMETMQVKYQAQFPGMDEEARTAFLAPYLSKEKRSVLGLCVMGGIFSEGIDLPGEALDGVVIVGVGLPQVNTERELLKTYLQEKTGDGFLYAYMIPGLQKVAQAGGRVIRTETDKGFVLLLDERFGYRAYFDLLPAHWQVWTGESIRRLEAFRKENVR